MLLTAGVSKDHRIRLVADGPDEDAAIDALVGLVESGLGEPPPPDRRQRRVRLFMPGPPPTQKVLEPGADELRRAVIRARRSPPSPAPAASLPLIARRTAGRLDAAMLSDRRPSPTSASAAAGSPAISPQTERSMPARAGGSTAWRIKPQDRRMKGIPIALERGRCRGRPRGCTAAGRSSRGWRSAIRPKYESPTRIADGISSMTPECDLADRAALGGHGS